MKIRVRDFVLLAVTFVALVLMEAFQRAFTLGFEDNRYIIAETVIIVAVCASAASLLFLIKTAAPGRAGKVLYSAAMGIIILLFLSQIVYYGIFSTYFTFYSMVNGAQVTEFMGTIFDAIWHVKFQMLTILIIGVAAAVIGLKADHRDYSREGGRRAKKFTLVISALTCFLFLGVSLMTGSVRDDDPQSPYQALHGVGEIQSSVRCTGLMGAMGVDLWKLATGFEPVLEDISAEEEIEPQPDDNVIDSLYFEALAEEEEDETIETMHRYFGSLEPTEKNDKTGIFEGKNLIFITAESFTDFAVSEKYTPTLYKLLTEGYNFTNFYNPIWGVSTLDGEYVNLQSLVPKPGVWSMKESAENYLPFTLGNQFSSLGYETKAYHDHSVYYYDRDSSHPNLGYEFKGQGRDYSFEKTWPESDIEMIDETTQDFLTPDEKGEIKPFHVYYLTVSGHMNYNFYGNDMAKKNRELEEDMDMPDACKAYMAGEIELDRALELLLRRLEEAGELEDTVIALAGDHYPYGLEQSAIDEFKGHEADQEYEIYESAFLLWTPGMEPETVDKLCSNMDILPTLSNMFGLEYDSRLFMGKDIFSSSEGFVLFKDKNWISEKGKRSELIGKDDEYVAEMDKKAAMMFNYSALILDKDYYACLDLEENAAQEKPAA